MRHSSHASTLYRKPIKPEPSKFYLEIKDKYGIKTEYIQKYGSSNYKNRCWDILRLWIDIINEKINEDSGNVSFKIYKKCLKELKFIDRYEIRFLCSICRLFYGINNNLMDDVWNDILLRVNVKGHKGDSAACISDFIKLAFEIKKIKGNKSYFINVVENTINHPFWGESGYIDQELEKFLDNLHQEDN